MRSQGWEVVDANFDDIAESSETLNRPAMQRLLDEIAVPRIVEYVSIDAVYETITVKLKSDALEFLD